MTAPPSMPAIPATSRRRNRCWPRRPISRWCRARRRNPPVAPNDPVLPERSNVFDIGIDQKIYADPRPRNGDRRLLQDRARLAGRRPVRPGLCAIRVQLRPRPECRRRTQGKLHQRQFPRLWQCRLGQTDATKIVSNQYLFGPDELAYIANTLRLYRPRPAADGVGRRVLLVERHPVLAST